MMSVLLFLVEIAAFRWEGVCIYPSSGCFHLLCPLFSHLPTPFSTSPQSTLLSYSLFRYIYIPHICDKPIWQLNLHPTSLYPPFAAIICLGHSAVQYILIISFIQKQGDLPPFLHRHHLAVLLLLGNLCVCACHFYTERFRSCLDRLPPHFVVFFFCLID
ncbi:hypothetical protein ASPBRDRAFT_388076 [Aspergillus brasiliensis CBS 101740]|uniref:Uncharacterized protein n=1 Tax=Aspergillus brasiliensis (strain CBS 101740 / IMI 381727 / IBT 21946) TaxID=767769 RepID=A0A1L9UW61_ASPBC|nr:hypothetical protein ASPBRDRAFT_388076 [Aspergillus brasiliensis CBS 101740]